MADILFMAAGALALIAMFLAAFRFFKGPEVVDRVIAFDVITIISISIIAFIGHVYGRIIYIDVAVVYGLLSFLGVIIVAKYLERGL